MEIIEDEAAVVRRIFSDYAAGATPRNIAGSLNKEGIAPPRASCGTRRRSMDRDSAQMVFFKTSFMQAKSFGTA